jgi:ABC-type transporter Mla MlaB component
MTITTMATSLITPMTDETADEAPDEAPDAFLLPAVLDRAGIAELGVQLAQARTGASIRLDGSQIRRVHTPGVQQLCAMVLAAEGRGATVVWTAVPPVLVTYVRLLGISDVLQFHRGIPDPLENFE